MTETTDDDLSWVERGMRIMYADHRLKGFVLAEVADVDELKRAVQAKTISHVRPFPP